MFAKRWYSVAENGVRMCANGSFQYENILLSPCESVYYISYADGFALVCYVAVPHSYQLLGPWKIWKWLTGGFQTQFTNLYLRHFLWNRLYPPKNNTGDKSTLFQVWAWCRLATPLAQGDPDLCGYKASLGHDDLTDPCDPITIILLFYYCFTGWCGVIVSLPRYKWCEPEDYG